MIINDSIYLLDESLSKLSEIRGYQVAMQSPAEWNQQDPVWLYSLLCTELLYLLDTLADQSPIGKQNVFASYRWRAESVNST